MRLAAHVGLGLLFGCGPRLGADGDGGGSQTDGAATDGVSASSAGSGSGADGEWVCPTTVAEPPWCYERLALPGVEWPRVGIPIELGDGRGMGLALPHKAGSDNIWNGGPVSLVAWEDGRLILTHGDFAHPALTPDIEDFRAVRLSGNAAEDLLVYNRISGDHFIELLVLEDDRWVLTETKPVALPEGFEYGNVPLLPRDPAGAPLPLLVERDVGFYRLVRGEDAWTLTGMIPLPPELPEGGGAARPSYGDVDRDGREDVLVSFSKGSTEQDKRLVLLMADLTSAIGFRIVDLGPYTLEKLDLGDFDGDGRLDILEFGGRDPLRFALHRGHGDGTFDAPVSGEVATPDTGGGVMTRDVDRDGVRELFVSTPAGLFVIDELASGGVKELMLTTPDRPVGAVDMNGDGHFDLVTELGRPEAHLLISIVPGS